VTHLLTCAHDISVLGKNTNAVQNTAPPLAASGSWFRNKRKLNIPILQAQCRTNHNIT